MKQNYKGERLGTDLEVLSEEEESLQVIRRKFNVSQGRFNLGVAFAKKTLDGMSRNKAYMETFECTPDKAKQSSSQFHRGKWIQELILYMSPDRESLYVGETKRIIARLMGVINDPRSSAKELTDSARALQPYIKIETKRLEVDHTHTLSSGESIAKSISEKIDLLVEQGKMISPQGDIIDVETIE